LAAGASTIDVLSLGAPGQAQNIQTLDIAGPAKSAGLTISMYSAFPRGREFANRLTDPNNFQGMTAFVKS